jgi:uncharacterized membrane protein
MNVMSRYKPPAARTSGRIKVIAAGLFFILAGMLRVQAGIQVVKHWTGQPVFSWAAIATGGLLVILALIPGSWIARIAGTQSSKPTTGSPHELSEPTTPRDQSL